MAPVIVARDIYKCYPGFAPVLRGASIDVECGEMAAIMGPSGCGKSTMLHIIGMLHAPDSGSLEILGANVLNFDREQTAAFRRGNMGFVMQSSNLFEHSTVFENVEFPLIYENVPPQERWARVIHALELVRLSARVHYRSNRLSGGEQQRVAIARAMVNNPRILLADEPTGALDARTSVLIMENFRNLCHSGGVAMIMVTHDPKMANFCDSIYTLEEGVLVRKKHDSYHYSGGQTKNLLAPPEPLIRGALVTGRFPPEKEPYSLELATAMNSSRLLSRIYSTHPSAFLSNPQNYSLPLPVRHTGHWQSMTAILAFMLGAHGTQTAKKLWRELPGTEKKGALRNFVCGEILSRWGAEDQVQYLHAANAGSEATAAWIAAKLLRRPFGFSVSGADLRNPGPDLAHKANDAAVITCATASLKKELCRLLPVLVPEKVLVLRPQLLNAPSEDETDKSMPQQGEHIVSLLTVNPTMKQLQTILQACAQLKAKGRKFGLVVAGRHNRSSRWQAKRLGLGKICKFEKNALADSIGDLYRNANIYIASPEADNPLTLPEPVCLAMAYGLGMAVNGMTPGLAEALEAGHNCLASAAGNAAALADNLDKLVNNTELTRRLGVAARSDINALLNDVEGSGLLQQKIIEAGAARQNAQDLLA